MRKMQTTGINPISLSGIGAIAPPRTHAWVGTALHSQGRRPMVRPVQLRERRNELRLLFLRAVHGGGLRERRLLPAERILWNTKLSAHAHPALIGSKWARDLSGYPHIPGRAGRAGSCAELSPTARPDRMSRIVLRRISKITAVDQPNISTPFIAVIGPISCHCFSGITSP